MTASSRTIEHVGEWRVELRGASPADVFQELARVIARAAGTASGSYGDWQMVDVQSRDREGLLVDYANELVSRSEIDQRAYDDIRDVTIGAAPPRLRARIRGRAVRSWRSPLKAATYHGATLAPEGDGWRANVLFDV